MRCLISLAILSAATVVNSFRDTEVKLTSDGPAVLDSKITFVAVLVNSESYSGPFFFRWSKYNLLFFYFALDKSESG
jgi:hypothetical protein